MMKWNRGTWWIGMILLPLLFTGCRGGTIQNVSTPTASSTSGTVVDTPVTTTGCGKAASTTAGTSASFSLTSGGLKRSYLMHIPVGYNASQMTPLVLNIHGRNETAQQQEVYSQYSTLADQAHFIVVYPQGEKGSSGEYGWATYGKDYPKVNDVLFFSDLLTKLQQQLCIDPHRIYATGISNGGGMTNLLACKMAGRIAAFAAIAAAIYPIPGGCHPSRPIAYLEFHGTSDPLVHYNGEKALNLAPVMQTMQDWALRDGCASNPTTFFQRADITGFKWSSCQSGVNVEHYRIDGGGHTWPGAVIATPLLGSTTHTISATTLSWQFFQQYQL